MTQSGTDSATMTWHVAECPFTVECSARVLDDIRLAVMDAFFSLPRGGAEIGGILLGRFENTRLVIAGYAALDCEHAYGPSFTLSPPDEARLEQLLSTHANLDGGLRPVGWYHSHTRSEIFLSDADLKIHQRFFPESWQVALVMKPHTFQPARIGFFFREADGSVHANASYREEVLDAAPIRQMPSGAPAAPPSNEPPPRRFRQEPASEHVTLPATVIEPAPSPLPEPAPLPLSAAVLEAAPSPLPEPRLAPAPPPPPATVIAVVPLPAPPAVDLPVPKFLVANASYSRRWMVVGIGIVAFLGTIGAAFQIRQMWLPRVLAAMRPASAVTSPPPATPAPAPVPAALGLNMIDREGQLQIVWDHTSPSVQHASDALLEIDEGGPKPTTIPLDAAHLQSGAFTYARTADKVDVKLIVHQAKGSDFREVARFFGQLPERKPAEDPQAQELREEMARQAARLKADLTIQAAKAKKLEQDVKSMRDETRRQQLRRLNNQVGDR